MAAVLCTATALAFAAGAEATEKKFKVGVSLPEAQNPFYVLMGKSIVTTFEKRGIEAILLSANADVNEQVNNINDLIAAKVDAILVSPLDLEGPAPAVQAANGARIPVFMIARRLDDRYRHLWRAFIGFDLSEVGALKGQWVVKSLQPGKAAMLLGPAGSLFAVEQERGFRRVIEPAGFTVVWAQNSTQTRENGLKLAEDALVSHRDLKVIYASNDDLALGAAQAVKAAGLRGKVHVLGTNGAPPALAAVHNEDMAATVLLDPISWGRQGAEVVADFLQKRKAPESQDVILTSELITPDKAYDKIPPPLREKFGVKPK
ncbi:MAG: ABC transporter substrate-binding protein [Candidatus Rokubacteria bacterium]|nr:ABC transporter substrate-binding protein [Candidatus Rokubacteria bacterium]